MYLDRYRNVGRYDVPNKTNSVQYLPQNFSKLCRASNYVFKGAMIVFTKTVNRPENILLLQNNNDVFEAWKLIWITYCYKLVLHLRFFVFVIHNVYYGRHFNLPARHMFWVIGTQHFPKSERTCFFLIDNFIGFQTKIRGFWFTKRCTLYCKNGGWCQNVSCTAIKVGKFPRSLNLFLRSQCRDLKTRVFNMLYLTIIEEQYCLSNPI